MLEGDCSRQRLRSQSPVRARKAPQSPLPFLEEKPRDRWPQEGVRVRGAGHFIPQAVKEDGHPEALAAWPQTCAQTPHRVAVAMFLY